MCYIYVYKQTGLNGGYYATSGLQQAHSTTHDVAHSAAGSALIVPPPPSVVNPSPVPTVPSVHIPPQVGLQHGLVSSKSVGIDTYVLLLLLLLLLIVCCCC